MVEVKQGTLCPLKEHVLLGSQGIVDNLLHRSDVRSKPLRPLLALVKDFLRRNWLTAIYFSNDGIRVFKDALKSRQQRLHIQQVRCSDAGARRLVGVSRANALAGRADRAVAACLLGENIQRDVVWHDDVRTITDNQPVLYVYALFGQAVYLVEKDIRIDDHSIANHIHSLGPEHTARNDVEAELAILVDDGMSGVVAAGEPRHNVGVTRQHIDYLSFSFVAPLST